VRASGSVNDARLRDHILNLSLGLIAFNRRILVDDHVPAPAQVEFNERERRQLRAALETMFIATDGAFDVDELFEPLGAWRDVGQAAHDRVGKQPAKAKRR
jgi:hypothetical protein